MCVPENEWKRPTVNVAIWKEEGRGGEKGTQRRRRRRKSEKIWGRREVEGEEAREEGARRDVHYCSTVEGGVSQ